ncbi:MAG: class II fructose-bisphosphate aldolase [Candidatus Giovannonibacteria bacterium]|nr:MAG: class II fructose-bisphosphate aldolase [Candidatus Giovannonibacteria bacterium]
MNLNDYLNKALKEGWATGHFNASESDQFRAICEAALEISKYRNIEIPAIIGTSEGEAKHLGYFEAVALRDAFRKELGTPVFLNSDHHKSVEAAKKAVDAGYDSIHIDLSAEPYEENVAGTKEIVEYAKNSAIGGSASGGKNFQISVEGELGYLRGESKIQKEKITVKPEDLTNPDTAKNFISRTGVNRLAIAVGNIHGLSLGEPTLDIERIKKIREAVPKNVALVLHGGSGIPDEQIKAAIGAGIANIHINTDIRVAYTMALREEFSKNPDEVAPYKFDSSAREAVKKIVKEKLILFCAEDRI